MFFTYNWIQEQQWSALKLSNLKKGEKQKERKKRDKHSLFS